MTEDSDMRETQFVVFNLGTEEFGVEISQVREIIKMTAVTKVPNAPYFVEGMINLRGQITAVTDLRKMLNIASKDDSHDDKTRIVIVELPNMSMGMIVDAVLEVLSLSAKDIDDKPTIISEVSTEYIRGVGKLEDRLLILLDLNKILSHQELTKLRDFKRGTADTTMEREMEVEI